MSAACNERIKKLTLKDCCSVYIYENIHRRSGLGAACARRRRCLVRRHAAKAVMTDRVVRV